MYKALEDGVNYFLRLAWNKVDGKTAEIVCMGHSAISSIGKKFMEEGNLIDSHKVKRNSNLGVLRATRKLHRFDQLHLNQYINHQYLKGRSIIRMELCSFLKAEHNISVSRTTITRYLINIGLS